MAFTWALSEIRSRFRELTGRPSTSQISDANCNNWINQYYLNVFPKDAEVDTFNTWFTQDIDPEDSGDYPLSTDYHVLGYPCTLNGETIELYRDKDRFFTDFPDIEEYITPPTLVVGSTSTQVGYSGFSYMIAGNVYTVSSSSITLSGNTIPQNKYGGFVFSIDADGTVTVQEAANNSTGYVSRGLVLTALQGLAMSADRACMGYLMVISTDSDGFVPGTTALDDSAVTDYYTDGSPSNRSVPVATCIADGYLYVRPKPADTGRIRLSSISEKPTALSDDSDTPSDIEWGLALANGAAYLYLMHVRETQAAAEKKLMLDELLKKINNKKYGQDAQQIVQRSF